MPTYDDGHIRKLAETLVRHKVEPVVVTRVMTGGEEIRKTSPRARKVDWLRLAMRGLDQEMDQPTRLAVRESSACCLGGKRHELACAIATQHKTLAERLAAANAT